jgi:hypothetical protein
MFQSENVSFYGGCGRGGTVGGWASERWAYAPVAVFFLPKHCTLWEAILCVCSLGRRAWNGGKGRRLGGLVVDAERGRLEIRSQDSEFGCGRR